MQSIVLDLELVFLCMTKLFTEATKIATAFLLFRASRIFNRFTTSISCFALAESCIISMKVCLVIAFLFSGLSHEDIDVTCVQEVLVNSRNDLGMYRLSSKRHPML